MNGSWSSTPDDCPKPHDAAGIQKEYQFCIQLYYTTKNTQNRVHIKEGSRALFVFDISGLL